MSFWIIFVSGKFLGKGANISAIPCNCGCKISFRKYILVVFNLSYFLIHKHSKVSLKFVFYLWRLFRATKYEYIQDYIVNSHLWQCIFRKQIKCLAGTIIWPWLKHIVWLMTHNNYKASLGKKTLITYLWIFAKIFVQPR